MMPICSYDLPFSKRNHTRVLTSFLPSCSNYQLIAQIKLPLQVNRSPYRNSSIQPIKHHSAVSSGNCANHAVPIKPVLYSFCLSSQEYITPRKHNQSLSLVVSNTQQSKGKGGTRKGRDEQPAESHQTTCKERLNTISFINLTLSVTNISILK